MNDSTLQAFFWICPSFIISLFLTFKSAFKTIQGQTSIVVLIDATAVTIIDNATISVYFANIFLVVSLIMKSGLSELLSAVPVILFSLNIGKFDFTFKHVDTSLKTIKTEI